MEGGWLTCYFRHKQMKDAFEKASVVITKENRKDVDRVVHSIVGVDYKNCPDTWRAVKTKLAEDEVAFIQELSAKMTV